MVQVINSVEDKRYFNNLNFIKLKFHNQLTTHLEFVVWMFVQQFYTLNFFSYIQITNFQYYEISVKSMQNLWVSKCKNDMKHTHTHTHTHTQLLYVNSVSFLLMMF
jgi:hypothetical protein